MQIFAQLPRSAGDSASDASGGASPLPEWVVIELQGDLESRSGNALSRQLIGDLHFSRSGQPVLIVGHHIMWGRVADLRPPMLLFDKVDQYNGAGDHGGEYSGDDTKHEQCQLPDDSTANGNAETHTQSGETVNGGDITYLVRAIIRKKILFKTRPKPIIAHVPTKL